MILNSAPVRTDPDYIGVINQFDPNMSTFDGGGSSADSSNPNMTFESDVSYSSADSSKSKSSKVGNVLDFLTGKPKTIYNTVQGWINKIKNIGKSTVASDSSNSTTSVDKPTSQQAAADSKASDLINNLTNPRDWLDVLESFYKQTLDYNMTEAQKDREWQAMMSNTAYQRAVEDLKKAGINPLLALQGSLGPASTPSGAQAHGSNVSSNPLYGDYIKLIASILQFITGESNALTKLIPNITGK